MTTIALIRKVLGTRPAAAPAVARVALGLVMFPHGAQHALGWFGGYGFSGTLGWMTDTLGFPAPAAALAIAVELLAPFALVAGVGGRLAAAGIIGLMLGALGTHVPNGFFMNWFGAMKAGVEGYEYHLIAIALGAVVVVEGSGALSVDRLLTRHDADDSALGTRAGRGARRARAA
jgi:putative oxidoreductase